MAASYRAAAPLPPRPGSPGHGAGEASRLCLEGGGRLALGCRGRRRVGISRGFFALFLGVFCLDKLLLL